MAERPRFDPLAKDSDGNLLFPKYKDLPDEAKPYFSSLRDGFILRDANSNDVDARRRVVEAKPARFAVL